MITQEEHRKSRREYMRERWVRFCASGLCGRCGKQKPQGPDTSHCAECTAKVKSVSGKVYHSRKSKGLCTACGTAPRGETLRCEPCREVMHAWFVRKRKGCECRRCGAPVGRTTPLSKRDKLTYCEPCFTHSRIRKYPGLTEQKFKALGDACQICGAKKDLNIDHDHNAEAVRGLLCHQCNSGLGMFRDSPELLIRACEYLTASGYKVTDGPIVVHLPRRRVQG